MLLLLLFALILYIAMGCAVNELYLMSGSHSEPSRIFLWPFYLLFFAGSLALTRFLARPKRRRRSPRIRQI